MAHTKESLKLELEELIKIRRAMKEVGYYVKDVQRVMASNYITINAIQYAPHHDKCIDDDEALLVSLEQQLPKFV